ncbi:peptide chain release factor N(5)-glutamine methyltransferase [Flavobacterium supellecticarium]|uniref:Release factor glutamine methyltransferase n=1 Tax=Flavobacterium supellecticarium TaxID=2565924 RepID=A0A4S3ZZF1_9FLAO|nr:peptide chain release factor N(5)-glutamine methyltransferase [Flavobacterium supellecticarium]THF51363.1 peptide chain release factor N(5)-glutamine methyltransferase [Flavobacterium supellecticarium]
MLLKEYRDYFKTELVSIYDEKEIDSFFYITLEAFHQMKRLDLALQPAFELDGMQLLQWETVLHQLKEQRPIQYIFEETEFFGLSFYVNENVLIPRPETEELVEWILNSVSGWSRDRKIRILDIGTGSGCIAVSLAKNLPEAEVYAIDVSEKALEVARRNARQLEAPVTFWHKDILETTILPEMFDIIVSNPPYVRNLEKQEISKNVLEFEPHLALFVDDHDPLLFYRKITELATKNLNHNGLLFFEINQYLGSEMQHLLESNSFLQIELRKDIYENDRMTKAVWGSYS